MATQQMPRVPAHFAASSGTQQQQQQLQQQQMLQPPSPNSSTPRLVAVSFYHFSSKIFKRPQTDAPYTFGCDGRYAPVLSPSHSTGCTDQRRSFFSTTSRCLTPPASWVVSRGYHNTNELLNGRKMQAFRCPPPPSPSLSTSWGVLNKP